MEQVKFIADITALREQSRKMWIAEVGSAAPVLQLGGSRSPHFPNYFVVPLLFQIIDCSMEEEGESSSVPPLFVP